MADEKRIYELDPIADNAVSDTYVVPIDDDSFLETQKVTVAGINLIEKTRAEGVENAIIAGAGLESDGSYEADNSTYYITAQNFVDAGLSETQSNALILLDAAIKAVDDKTACYQKTFTAAEILGLDSTPIEFMPAPSPSFMYDLVHIYGWITFNTTAYDGSSPLRLRFVGEGTELANIPLTFLEAAGTTYFKGTVNNDVELVSAAIELYSDDPIIDGDSEITLVGCYALVPNTLYPSVCDPMCVPEVPFGVDTGALNAAVVVTGTPYAPAQGAEVVVELAFTATSGTPTCAINGSAAITMCNNDETGTAIIAGQLVKGGRYTLSYDSALAKYKVKNPSFTRSTVIPHAADGGAADAYTGTYTPAIVLTDGQIVSLDVANANVTSTPTFNASSTGVKTIVNSCGGILMPGQMAAGGRYLLQYDSGADKWVLLNPSMCVGSSSWQTKTVVFGDLNVAATTKTIAVYANLPAGWYVSEGYLHLKTNFTGGSISAITMAQQNGSNTFGSALSIFTGAGDAGVRRFSFATNANQSDMVSAWTFNLLFTSTGANLNALGAGEVVIYYKLSKIG